jgi:hypothetical protein
MQAIIVATKTSRGMATFLLLIRPHKKINIPTAANIIFVFVPGKKVKVSGKK